MSYRTITVVLLALTTRAVARVVRGNADGSYYWPEPGDRFNNPMLHTRILRMLQHAAREQRDAVRQRTGGNFDIMPPK